MYDHGCGSELRWKAGQSWFVIDVDLPASRVVESIVRTGSYRLPDSLDYGRAFDQSAVLASADRIHAGIAERCLPDD